MTGLESWKIVLTAGLTIFGSVVVFVAGQLLQRVVIDPVTDQRRAAAGADAKLTFWAWAYSNPQEQKTPERDRAMDELRESAANLLAATNSIRWWWMARWWGVIPEESADRAARILIGLSNGVYGRYVHGERPANDAQMARSLLGLRIAARARGDD